MRHSDELWREAELAEIRTRPIRPILVELVCEQVARGQNGLDESV